MLFFFFSSRRRHTRLVSDWSSDVCSSDLENPSPVSPRSPTVTVTELPRQTRPSAPRRSEERRVGKGVDLGGRRIIKKKKRQERTRTRPKDKTRQQGHIDRILMITQHSTDK